MVFQLSSKKRQSEVLDRRRQTYSERLVYMPLLFYGSAIRNTASFYPFWIFYSLLNVLNMFEYKDLHPVNPTDDVILERQLYCVILYCIII